MGATVALTLGFAGCSDGDASGTAETQPTLSTTAASGDTPAITTGEATAEESVLAEGLGAVGTRYAFTASVVLDGTENTRIVGTVYDGTGAYVVTSASATVDYVAGPQGQWAREFGGQWTSLAGAAPLIDPLAPLANPLRVMLLESDGEKTLIEATYDGAALGFAAGGDVTVTITITAGTVTSISYEVPVGDGIATVTTTFDGTADVSPIQVPPA